MSVPDVFLPDWLGRCADNFPDRLAIKYQDQRWSFAELDHRAARMACQLATLGVREGKRVASLAANSADYVVLVHALTKLGAVLVPLNIRLTCDELCWQLRDVRAEFLINDAQHAGIAATIATSIPQLARATFAHEALAGETILTELPEAHHPLRPLIHLDATQVIMYTSGTTGAPKGVIITFGMQWWNAVGSALNLGHAQDDCWLDCMPLFHIGGLSILMRSVIYGISVIVHEKFDVTTVNRAIHEDHVTIVSVVAVMLQRMLEASGQEQYPEALRCVLLGGGPAPRPLLEDCARRHIPVAQTYGLTESCSQAVTLAPADALRKLGSAGKALSPVQLRIMREDGEPARVNEPGVIYLKGPTITPGYDGQPDATAQVMREGWFSTGDLGYLDDEGYLYVLDRRTDLIISGGENVYPAEIEAVLLSHPDIEEAGVCGIDDAQWGQVPVAFVRKQPGSTISEDALSAYAASRLARYKLPKTIH
ncbi:MAG TPA: o-succinylbenzoate--CoA ligase, partial [Ktedonobacteraceae bacterium]